MPNEKKDPGGGVSFSFFISNLKLNCIKVKWGVKHGFNLFIFVMTKK